MAGLQREYISQNEYLLDKARSSGLFDEEYFQTALETDQATNYVTIMSTAKDNLSQTFDKATYDRLSGSDRFNYFVTENLLDKSSEEYKTSKAYFNQQIENIKNQEIFEGLNGFEKTMATIGGVVGNMGVQVVGVVEGLIDVVGGVVGAKDFVAKDITGYTAAQEALNDFAAKYTFIDKNGVARVINDVASGIVKMAPLIAGAALTPYTGGVSAKIGAGIYYASMAGNTAEEVIRANPDIDYLSLVGYVGSTTALEYLTEKVSGKLFGDDIVSAMIKGEKYAPTGGIFKMITKNFATEGLEEATSEIFSSILYKQIVDQNAELASIKDILYAALIGGLTGAIMSGGNVLTTTKKSVHQGQLVDTRSLTKEQKKTARNLSKLQSFGLQALSTQFAQEQTTEVTKLMAEYGVSLQDLQTKHADEYQSALEKDNKTQESRSKTVLELSKLLQTIGVEQFKKSATLLNKNVEASTEMLNNYYNHTDVTNKAASDLFAKVNPGKTFTASAIPTNSEQTLAKTLRQAYPKLNIVFGKYGTQDGSAVKNVNLIGNTLYIQSGDVDALGYDNLLNQSIRLELADSVMQDLEGTSYEQDLVTLVTEDSTRSYSELTDEEKRAIAQAICFDPATNRRVFLGDGKTHAKIFKNITKKTEFERKYGKNKIKFHNLLEIRDNFIKSIADTIASIEDVVAVQASHELSDEETKTKIIDKTKETELNRAAKITNIKHSKQATTNKDAIADLSALRQDTTVDFDYSRMFDETYYAPEFVQSITQGGVEFKDALQAYLKNKHNALLVDKNQFATEFRTKSKPEDVDKLAKKFLTKEFLDTNPDLDAKMNALIDVCYPLTTPKTDTTAKKSDSLVVNDDGTVDGTGALSDFHMNIQLFADNEDVGYHYGDISYGKKADTRDIMPGRDTGHFGTGFYLVSTPDRLKEGGSEYAKRNQDVVDMSKYKLFKPNTSEDAEALHDALKAINDLGHVNNISMTVDDVYDLDYENPDLLDILKDNGFSEYTLDRVSNFIKNKEYGAAEQELIKVINKADELLNDAVNAAQVLSKLFNVEFSIVENNMTQALASESNDSYSTVFMKKMGYNGVDVRHLESHDNWQYGSVIYDIAPETIISSTKPSSIQNGEGSKSKSKTNITDKDLEQLGSTSYKTGETRKSKTKGLEDVEYEVSYVMDYETHNRQILNKIKTLNDLRQVVNAIKEGKITGVEATHLLNLLQAEVIPFNFYGNESAMQLIKDLLSQRTTETAQELASRSELFAETHPVENLVNELTEKFGEKINVPEDVVVKWVPYYADRKNYLKRIKDEYQELQDKRDNTDDPYLKQQYTIKLKDLRTLAKMVADENTAGVLDYYMSELKNSDTDKVENNEKIQDITKDLVTALVQHTDMSSLKPKYDPTKKSILKPEHAQKLANFWETVNGFRYLALLSSPATWGRNAITNTLISINAIVEDTLSGMIEKTRLLRAESQASYTGDYDQEFSEFIDEEFAPEVEKDTSGDKYNTTELEAIKREYAIENDPMKKHELLYKIKEFEQKMLNDKPWTKRRVLRNLKNTLAGSINMISNNVYGELKALYHGDNAAEILANMRKTNSPLADLFEQVYITNNNDDMIGVIKLAKQLSSSSQVIQEIYDNALYRGNKLLFKTENFLTKRISSLKKSHPAVAGFLSLFIPFARTSWNTSAYIVNHSPVGLIKGIIKGLQTRNMYIGDMRQEITNHYKNEYIKQNKKPNANFEFSQKKFDEWLSKNVSGDIVAAINGDTKSIKAVFDTMAEQGLVNSSLIGSNDIFARATTIESVSQGLTGTAMLSLGLILGALCEGFKIDEDDYLGPVLTVGNVRIKLSDLSPYATMFSVGAIVNSSDSVLDAFGNFASIMVDASMLNVIESAIQYSDGVVDYLGNQSINIVQQFIPAIFKSVTKTLDNAKKDKSGNYFERLYKTTFANTPFLSYLVANKIDPYTGETEKIYQSGLLEALWHNISPIGTRTVVMSDMEREARALGVGTTGLTGRFTINEVDYTVKNKEKYAKYRAEYIEKQFTDIFNNKQKVTVEDSNGKRITTTYDKLTDEQKKNVIERLYTEASAMTKIKWWIDAGNKYVVTDRDTYTKYRTLFDSANIVYKTTWTKSKFVEA